MIVVKNDPHCAGSGVEQPGQSPEIRFTHQSRGAPQYTAVASRLQVANGPITSLSNPLEPRLSTRCHHLDELPNTQHASFIDASESCAISEVSHDIGLVLLYDHSISCEDLTVPERSKPSATRNEGWSKPPPDAGFSNRRGGIARSIAPRNLHDHVIHELGRRIVGGELQVGQVLPRENVLSEQMSVSRTVLREALKVLGAKGLVESRPKVGTRVREARFWHQLDADVLAWRCASMPTDNFVQKLIELREILEPAAAAAAAQRCSVAQLARLDAAYASMAAARNLEEWTEADLAFHETVLDATNNELMTSLFAVIETSLGAFFSLSAKVAKDFRYSLPHHQKVLECIRRRQPHGARRAMQRLIADSRDNLTHGKPGKPSK